ncbi:MAG TPA: ATP-binding protein [Syntrophorhabdaceae bacterium]|nr:ATP-binding protein [Syntrophorhabdaceae bacterium]HPP07341.1 ATP-binding protein [Syntrophorhabdaceae bacterium]
MVYGSAKSDNKLKEIVVVSGKGGTGKTSLTGALCSLIKDKVVADCDVDAANLHLIVTPQKIISRKEFIGGKKAAIDLKHCTQCNICRDACNYDAISEDFIIDPVLCEGCGACYFLCPAKAVFFEPQKAGFCYTSTTLDGSTFVFAELLPGEENSGKLVAMVRNEAKEEAIKANKYTILIDGPPGIGCPVISSVTGTQLAITVTEPTPSGIHDLKRITDLTKHFNIKTAIVVNKSDINPFRLNEIKGIAIMENLIFLGEIPYDTTITLAQKQMKTIIEFAPDCEASKAIISIYKKLKSIMEEI